MPEGKGANQFSLQKYRAVVFDMDGTLYRGEEIIPGTAETISRLLEVMEKVVFVTNKTTGSASDYAAFLQAGGIHINPEQIITSTSVTVAYLKQNFASASFFAVGELQFIQDLLNAGLKYTEDPQKAKLILITLDRDCTFHKLEVASKCLDAGARFFAANIDTTCPVEGGEIWDAGSTIAALEKRTHRKLELHFGKPSDFMIRHINAELSIPPEETLLIGDRLETDILMGNRAGMDTVLVESGVKNYVNGDDTAAPTFIMPSVSSLLHYL